MRWHLRGLQVWSLEVLSEEVHYLCFCTLEAISNNLFSVRSERACTCSHKQKQNTLHYFASLQFCTFINALTCFHGCHYHAWHVVPSSCKALWDDGDASLDFFWKTLMKAYFQIIINDLRIWLILVGLVLSLFCRALMGSVSNYVVNNGNCPVTVVKSHES